MAWKTWSAKMSLRKQRRRGGADDEIATPPQWGPEPSATASIATASERDRGIDLVVATAVLDVGNLLSSPEMKLRLARAVDLLPDVTVILPEPGERFDPDRHLWERTEPAPSPQAAETIASTESAGLLGPDGVLTRPARVVVYDTIEEQK